jgi:hypothetical protein
MRGPPVSADGGGERDAARQIRKGGRRESLAKEEGGQCCSPAWLVAEGRGRAA